jgi:hypothetical protein
MQGPPKAPQNNQFEPYLLQAMRLLLGSDNGGDGGGVRFGDLATNVRQNKQIQQIWKLVQTDEDDEEEYQLELQPGTSPTQATDAIFANLNDYAFDCAEAIPVAWWYAMRHVDAQAFNQLANHATFILSAHDSTGLQQAGLYSRTDDEGYYDQNAILTLVDPVEKEPPTIAGDGLAFIDAAPVGTRIVLTCTLKSVEDTDYENENVLKIGPALYAAHPLGLGSLDLIITELAKTALDLDNEDDLNQHQEAIYDAKHHIYVSEIELLTPKWISK